MNLRKENKVVVNVIERGREAEGRYVGGTRGYDRGSMVWFGRNEMK